MQRIAVIGGGWYGCHIAAELIRKGYEVTLYEQAGSLFSGSSGMNQFRLHLGFHYPRSSVTRHQVADSHSRFLNKYPNLIYPVTKNVYGIANTDSLLDFATYKTVMTHDVGDISFEEIDPSSIGLTNLEGALVCSEGALLVEEPKRFFTRLLGEVVCLNQRVNEVRTMADVFGRPVGVSVDGAPFDWCVDCTYGQLTRCSRDIFYEVCLTLVYQRRLKNVNHLNHAITIMDGPFVSLFPYLEDYADATGDLKRLHTLTHVAHTHLARFENFSEAKEYADGFSEHDALNAKPLFEAGITTFLPSFTSDYDYHSYFVSFKTKLVGATDARETVCETYGRLIAVMSGKVNTIFEAEDYVTRVLLGQDHGDNPLPELKPPTISKQTSSQWSIATELREGCNVAL